MSITTASLIDEINRLRTNPYSYGEKIEKYITYIKMQKDQDGNEFPVLKLPKAKAGIRLREGEPAFKEAADFLKTKIDSAPPMDEVKGLTAIAKEFVDLSKDMSPEQIRAINMDDIIAKHGKYTGSFSRAMEFGAENAEQVIVSLIVSDGDPSRGKRETLLNSKLLNVGAASGPHSTFGTVSILVLCGEFQNK